MSPETARREIDRYAGILGADEKLHVLLMGGEPFLEFDLIKELVEYAEVHFPTKDILFKAVTNGTLVHGEIQNWLKKHQHLFHVEVSLDGPELSQNIQRPGTHGEIDIPFFKDIKDPATSTVVAPDTLSDLYMNVRYLAENGLQVKAVLADGVEWNRSHPAILAVELRKLAEYYLSHPDVYPFSMLAMATYCVNSEYSLPACIPGKSSVCIGADGKEYPCHRCSEYYNTGRWKIPGSALDLKEKYMNEACEYCIVRDICNACPASSTSLRQDPDQSRVRCMMLKVIFLASAYLHLHLLSECPAHIFLSGRNGKEKNAMMNGSRLILENLDPAVPF